MTMTTFEEFARLAREGSFVPVCKELMADLLTPVSAFLKVAEYSDYAFLLESVEGGEHVARYSFLGKDPLLVLRADGDRTVLEQAGETKVSAHTIVEELRRVMGEYRSPSVPGLPRFTGGAVGFLGYDAAGWFEPAVRRAGEGPIPAVFMVFDTILAFDHVRHRILVIANARVTPGADLQALYRFACARIDFLERELAREVSTPEPPAVSPLVPRPNVSREEFERGVRAVQAHIAEGDIY